MKPNFSTVLKWYGFPVEEAKAIFKEAQAADKKTWQTEKMWEIFNFHYKNNEFYRTFVGKKFTNWNDIPVIRPKDLKGDCLSKIPSIINTKKLYISRTSGTSSVPLYFTRDPLTHAIVWENVSYFYGKAGILLDDRQARMFGMSKKALDVAKNRVKDWISNRYRFNIFNLSDEALDGWVKRFRYGNFKYIYGYNNSLVVFAQYLINRNYTLKSIAPSLISCIITSELCSPKDAQILSKGFDIPIYNEYGTSELGIMGFKDNSYPHWDCSDELIYLEVLDENGTPVPDGEMGYLAGTDLFNKATPFIRYQVGDLAKIRRIDSHTQIIELMGRTNDLAIFPSGRKIPGFSFYFVVLNSINTLCDVKEFLFRQTSEGFNFEYVADKPLNDAERLKIKNTIDLHFKEDIKLSAVKVEKLERGKSGKFKQFISEI